MLKTLPKKLTALVLAIAVLFAGYTFYFSPRAFAQLTLQVNPEIVLTLSRQQTVLAATIKNLDDQPALTDLVLVGLPVGEALDKINATLTTLGFLTPEREVLIVVNPLGSASADEVQGIATAAAAKLNAHLGQQPTTPPAVTSVLVTAPLTEAAQTLTIPLSSFARFLRKGVTEANLIALMGLQDGLNLDTETFSQEFNKVVKSFADMREAGISEALALTLLTESMRLDSTLKNVYHIASSVIDMHEAGLAPNDISAALQLHRGLELTPAVFRRESDSLISSLIDMHEAGIPSATALSTLSAAISADPSLKGVDTIVSALIDLVDEGTPAAAALLSIKAAIADDPSLKDMENLLGLSPGRGRSDDKDDQEEQRGQGRGRDKDDAPGNNDQDDDVTDDDEDDSDDDANDDDDDDDDKAKPENKNEPRGRGRGN